MTTTSSESRRVLIGVGSNVGDRIGFLRAARRGIDGHPRARVAAASSVYETEPVGGPPQGRYLNAALVVETTLAPPDLLDALLAIEAAAGRTRSVRNAPRTLDLDVLLIHGAAVSDARLAVPHPRFAGRAFALIPAAEIAPDWPVPPEGRTVAQLAAACDADGVRRFGPSDSWAA